jgi:hypothetical protein
MRTAPDNTISQNSVHRNNELSKSIDIKGFIALNA